MFPASGCGGDPGGYWKQWGGVGYEVEESPNKTNKLGVCHLLPCSEFPSLGNLGPTWACERGRCWFASAPVARSLVCSPTAEGDYGPPEAIYQELLDPNPGLQLEKRFYSRGSTDDKPVEFTLRREWGVYPYSCGDHLLSFDALIFSGRIDNIERFQLAFRLIKLFLSLYNSPWICEWSSKTIFFFWQAYRLYQQDMNTTYTCSVLVGSPHSGQKHGHTRAGTYFTPTRLREATRRFWGSRGQGRCN